MASNCRVSHARREPRRTRSGNRRDEAARLAVLHAADDLFVEHGFGALTVEAIARCARVAMTIYRWWPSKVEILIEDSDKRLPVPTEMPTAETIRAYLRGRGRCGSASAALC
jgi:AcrR family transcriptional regulator